MSAPAVHHNRVLATRDFSGPDLAPYFADIFPHERTRFGDGWPAGHPYRKYWEVAMAARALDRHGVLHREAEVIGIGAGNEPTLFWLTRHVRRVFATDLYLTPGVWGDFANPAMLGAPANSGPAPGTGGGWCPSTWTPSTWPIRTTASTRCSHPARSSTSATSPRCAPRWARPSGCCAPAGS